MVEAATHIGELPVIVPARGVGCTSNVLDEESLPQPLVTTYLKDTIPAPSVVIAPEAASIVAIVLLLLLQVPPASPVVVAVPVAPAHREPGVVTDPALGSGFTVMAAVAVSEPQLAEFTM